MVDCFLINVSDDGTASGGQSLNFDISGKLAETVYTKIGNGNEADQQWIADVCLPVIGISSWSEVIPNYGQNVEKLSPQEDSVTSSGIYIAQQSTDGILAGLVNKITGDVSAEYSWYASKDGSSWMLLQDWSEDGEWLSWKPEEFGDYVIVAKARLKGSDTVATEQATSISYNPYIIGKCQMPYDGGGYLIGVETADNPNQSYRYEMLILDCTLLAAGQPAWVYTTGQFTVDQGNAGWCIWQPQYGYYWTLFRVYDADGTMIDEACYGFANVC
jgi:hypothetical protein